ncbi:MAG: glycosyltransferase family protein, partial [Planctomycetota bacterium]
LLAATPQRGDHLVAYCRRKMPANVLEALAASPCEVRVYGLGEQPDRGPLRFRPISEDGFIADLASARAVVGTAGNQLLGEVLYLGKPVLALPEAGQTEQLINCHFLARMGGGEWVRPHRFDGPTLGAFLERADGLAANIDRDFARGNERAVGAIEQVLASL